MEGLKVIESGIVPVYEDKEARILINARELHGFLESGRQFANWIQDRVERYNFVEGEDFFTFNEIVKRKDARGATVYAEYLLTIDTAKEIAMVENNQKGRQVRKYFIECEKRLKANSGAISAKDAEKLKQQAKRLDIMELNARNRQAQILKSVAEFFKEILSDASMQTIASEMTVLAAGERLVDLPTAEQLYSAAEIGEMCGISANMVGRVAKEYGLKTEEYGKFVLDKNPYNSRQVSTFQYKEKVAEKIREILATPLKDRMEEPDLVEA
jgi:anti-repressor protein